MSKLKYTGFDGHIILLCKNHYNITTDLFESLKMIWAIKCGYNYDKDDNSSIKYIMNSLYKILIPTINDHVRFQENLHETLIHSWYRDLTIEQRVLMHYIHEIQNLQIKEKLPNGKWETIIELPKPQKRLFNRILRGNGLFNDYKLITN